MMTTDDEPGGRRPGPQPRSKTETNNPEGEEIHRSFGLMQLHMPRPPLRISIVRGNIGSVYFTAEATNQSPCDLRVLRRNQQGTRGARLTMAKDRDPFAG